MEQSMFHSSLKIIGFLTMTLLSITTYADPDSIIAPKAWSSPAVPPIVSENVLYVPIAHQSVRTIPLIESGDELIDLLTVNHPRIRPLSTFHPQYANSYEGYSKVRKGVYDRLLAMLETLPDDVGIAYFEGFRTLAKQKEYFDSKLKEVLLTIPDKEIAYKETCRHVSPFIDNIPTHTTGAAIDITLFRTINDKSELLDMGKFDVIFGPNDQQDTFSQNTTMLQRENRLLLLEATAKAGLVNYGFEWWHYSYGDRVWAFVTKQKAALYSIAENKDDPILKIKKEDYLKDF